MLDGGYAREYHHIEKHIPQFESGIIRKLLQSPHYLGRSYSRKHRNDEKYIKNKRICKLIDLLRYKNGRGNPPRNLDLGYAYQSHMGHPSINIDCGVALMDYGSVGQLDLGNAYPSHEPNCAPCA